MIYIIPIHEFRFAQRLAYKRGIFKIKVCKEGGRGVRRLRSVHIPTSR